jgi:hypothetical protein
MNQFEVSEKLLQILITITNNENKVESQKYGSIMFFTYMIPLTQLFWKINEEKEFNEINTPARLNIEMSKLGLTTKQSTKSMITKRYYSLEKNDLERRLKNLYLEIETTTFYPVDKKVSRTIWNEEREKEEKRIKIDLMVANIKTKLLELLDKRNEDIIYLSPLDLLKELHELGFEYERKSDHTLDRYVLESEKRRLNYYMYRIGFKRAEGVDGKHRYKLYVIERKILEKNTEEEGLINE